MVATSARTTAEATRMARVTGLAYGGDVGMAERTRNSSADPGSNLGIVDGIVKQARIVAWSDVDGREAALVRRCAAGDDLACADLVSEHQRMVVQLAINLLGDRD